MRRLVVIMTKHYARISAGTAIAAALALSSTGGFAQEAPPASTDAAPPATSTPAPVVDAPPVTTDTTAPAAVEMDTSPPAAAPVKTVRRSTHVAAAAPKPVVTHTTTRTVTEHSSVPTAVAAAPVAPATPTASKVQPVVDLNAKSANAKPAPAKAASNPDETAMIAGGGALALLILGGGAYALTRRRRSDEEMWDEHADVDEPGTMGRHDPVFEHEPAMIAPSAFAWGNEQQSDPQVMGADDRQPGESWVERAYRGPSAENPSLSLRKRLKRAAFFDKREREVAAGQAAPVEADAGLPESVAEATPQRELEAA